MEAKNRTAKVWGASPAGAIYAGGAKPGTREFFETVRRRRNDYEIPWLAELVPFGAMSGRDVLEIGCGAGFDAYDFCKAGARYTGIDITPENPHRTLAHLSLYALKPKVARADAEDLPFGAGSFDVTYSNGVLHHTPDIARSLSEQHRVLKSGGEVWVILYHRNSIFYWFTLFLVEHLLYRGFRKRSLKERLSMIEYTTSDARPLVNVYGRGQVRRMLRDAGFTVEALWVRKLVVEDLPGLPVIGRLWKHLPRSWLDAAGMRFGWYVIARARKP